MGNVILSRRNEAIPLLVSVEQQMRRKADKKLVSFYR